MLYHVHILVLGNWRPVASRVTRRPLQYTKDQADKLVRKQARRGVQAKAVAL